MFMDTRAQAKRLLGSFEQNERKAVIRTAGCLLLALAVVFLPDLLGSGVFETMPPAAKASLGIMVFAASLWVTEAMPAFAVALLVIGLQIAILGNPGGVWAAEADTQAWTAFVQPWASPIMWLFLGGFVLAHACSKTRLDEWLAGMVLGRFATSPAKLVASVMAITFVFSMFMSNTATAAMMIAVTAPVLAALPKGSRLAKGIVLAVAAGANLGGIGTIIGTPPNAIAAGELQGKVDFLKWMAIALPPALLLAGAAYFFIWRIHIRGRGETPEIILSPPSKGDARQYRHRITVMLVFAITVAMWMGESLTGISSPVVSFIPIVAFAVTGVIGTSDMRLLPWDVLLLLAGGLSLGVGVEVTGLAGWFAGQVAGNLGTVSIAVVFSVLGLFLSNLMSNTAAAALLIPLASSLAGENGATLVAVSIAISCSAAMALPISTPPNAIAHGTGRLSSRDFLMPGLLVAAGMAAVLPWLAFALR
jgi:sodium-dependent dicarboxylate transporter 2/3/5